MQGSLHSSAMPDLQRTSMTQKKKKKRVCPEIEHTGLWI